VSEIIVPVTRYSPGQRTPKDQIRFRERPQTVSTHARGLSGTTMKTRAQIEAEDQITSVARNNPDNRDLPDLKKFEQTDANYVKSELGKFCRLHHDGGDGSPLAYKTSTAYLRYLAGMSFFRAIENDLVARGLAPAERGDAEWAGVPTDEELRARRDLCAKIRAEAESEAFAVDRRAVSACTKLCHEGLAISEHLHSLTKNALWRLSVHFGIEKAGYHG